VATKSAAQVSAAAFSWAALERLIASQEFSRAERQLRTYVQAPPGMNSAQAWLYLAQIFQQQARPEQALEAWFKYLLLEPDVTRRERALVQIQQYLAQLYERPNNLSASWLIAQLDKLMQNTAGDGALHLMAANLQLQLGDEYQAQYHALMAANDPKVQTQAEAILAKLGRATSLTDEVTVPLLAFGDQHLLAVTIDGRAAKLLLDTGASISGVSDVFIARYPALVRGATKPIQLNTASGTVESYLFNVDTLGMGSLLFQRHLLARLPMGESTEFDGLLGVDILGRYDFVIDRDALLLRLKARAK
jgi:predicted aspartyl protease